MHKLLYSLLLAFFCVASLLPAFALAQFSDIEKDSLTYMYRHGIIDGYPDGTFGPDKSINRAELLKMIMDASFKEPSIPMKDCFPDVQKNEWYAPYVCTAFDNGWVEGYPDGSFKPSQAINKVETLKIIAEVQDWSIFEACSNEEETTFLDVENCSWYYDYVVHAENHFFIDAGDKLEPAREILREQVAEILFRTIIEEKLGRIGSSASDMYDRTLPAIVRDFFRLEDGALSAIFEDAQAAANYAEDNPVFIDYDSSLKEPIYENRHTMIELEDGTIYAILPVPILEDLESVACPHYCLDPWMVAKFDAEHTLVAFDWVGLSQAAKYHSEWNLLNAEASEVVLEEWATAMGSTKANRTEAYSIFLEDLR